MVWNIWIIFPYIGNVIIPTDFQSMIFQRGWQKTTNQMPLKFPLDPIKPPKKIPLSHHKMPSFAHLPSGSDATQSKGLGTTQNHLEQITYGSSSH